MDGLKLVKTILDNSSRKSHPIIFYTTGATLGENAGITGIDESEDDVGFRIGCLRQNADRGGGDVWSCQ